MVKIRVLVVDDSVVARQIVSRALDSDPMIEIVGRARDGEEAIVKAGSLLPDLITMDVEMPGMGGLEAARVIHARHPKLPVIMVSSLTEEGAQAALQALEAGASDCVTKPTGGLDAAESVEILRESLVSRVKGLCIPPSKRPRIRVSRPGSARVDLVVIGVSTGGPNALSELIPMLPEMLPVPVLIVQHMPPVFTRTLAKRLDSLASLKVHEAVDGDPLEPGRVLVAPGDYHMIVEFVDGEMRIGLNQEPRENSCRPAVDPLFRSAAKHFGEHAMAIVLTGMGQDGLLGCRAIKERSGRIIVQDSATCVVSGMPVAIEQDGLADAVLPLRKISYEILQHTAIGRDAGTGTGRQSMAREGHLR